MPFSLLRHTTIVNTGIPNTYRTGSGYFIDSLGFLYTKTEVTLLNHMETKSTHEPTSCTHTFQGTEACSPQTVSA